MSTTSDPFYIVKNQVETSLAGINSLFSRWRVLLKGSNTAKNEEFKWHTEEIKRAIKTVNWDLADLEEAVDISSKDPEKYNLTTHEISDRRKFIASLKRQVHSISSELSSEATVTKLQQDQKKSLFAGGSEFLYLLPVLKLVLGGGGRTDDPNHDFSDGGGGSYDQAQILQIRERQNGQLDDLHQHMVRVHEMSTTINTEIGEHIEILQDVDDRVEYTSGRMGSALRKVDKLLAATGDKGALFIVVFLILVLIGLIVLVFKI